MQEGDITLTKQEQRRLLVLNQLEVGALVNQEGGQLARAVSAPRYGSVPHMIVLKSARDAR
jgi:hypothetical protein